MKREKIEESEVVRVLQKRIELYSDCSSEQRAAIDLHFRKMRLERTKTEALIWSIRLACAVLVMTIVWASYVRFCTHAAEEQFYSAACKLTEVEKLPVVLAECAARSIKG